MQLSGWIGLNDQAAKAAGKACMTSRTCIGWVWQRPGTNNSFALSQAGNALWHIGEPNSGGHENCAQIIYGGLNDLSCGGTGGGRYVKFPVACAPLAFFAQLAPSMPLHVQQARIPCLVQPLVVHVHQAAIQCLALPLVLCALRVRPAL